MIERSPAMLVQRRACAAIQREQADTKPKPDAAKLLRTEHLLAALQQKHSDVLLDKFAAGAVPDALSEAGSLSAAWSSYADVLADAVSEPAGALAQALDSLGGTDLAADASALCEGLASLALRIRGLRALGDGAAIASAATDIQHEISRLCQLFAAKVAGKRDRRGDGEQWDSIKKPSSGIPLPPDPDTTAPPAKEAKPGEQVNGG